LANLAKLSTGIQIPRKKQFDILDAIDQAWAAQEDERQKQTLEYWKSRCARLEAEIARLKAQNCQRQRRFRIKHSLGEIK
jgi:hypothetical protein